MSEASESWGQRLARGLMGVVFVAYALVCAILLFVDRNITYWGSNGNVPLLPNLAVFALIVVGMLLYQILRTKVRAARRICALDDKERRAICILATLALFSYQVASFYYAGILTGWDVGGLRRVSVFPSPISQTLPAVDWAYLYFSRYPNNLLLLILLRAQDHIRAVAMPSISPGVFYALVSMLLVSISFYLFTRVSARLFGRGRLSVAADVVFLVLAGLSPWYMIPYSDTYGLFLCTLMLCILVCYHNSVPALIVFGLLCAVGYNIKPTCIFIIISVCLSWLLESLGTGTLHRAVTDIVVIMVAFVVSLGVVNVTTGRLGISWDENARFTATHFAMMGLNDDTDGAYSADDVELSIAQPTVEAREKVNKTVIRERLEAYGPIGLAKHLIKKVLACFNDGTFTWGFGGEFFYETIGTASNDSSNFFHYMYPSDSSTGLTPYRVFCTIEQILWIICLMGIPLGILCPKKNQHSTGRDEGGAGSSMAIWLVIAYCVGAMLLFLLVFETRARYLYLYSGYFVLLGMHGYQQARIRLGAWHKNRLQELSHQGL